MGTVALLVGGVGAAWLMLKGGGKKRPHGTDEVGLVEFGPDGEMTEAWYDKYFRPKTTEEYLADMATEAPMAGRPVNIEMYEAEKELEIIRLALKADEDARKAMETRVPIENILTVSRLRSLREQYPGMIVLSMESMQKLKDAGIVPGYIKVVFTATVKKAMFSDETTKLTEVNAGSVFAVVPVSIAQPVLGATGTTSATLSGYGAQYEVHGGSGVTGLGY
jgi:hypothetical protein